MSESQQSPLAIEALISDRLQDLKLTPVELVRRCGYKNLSKGLRRLAGARAGYFDGQAWLLHALPDALGVPPEKVQQAVEDTRRYLYEEKEAAWRAAFKPHAIIITERDRPTQIFVAFFIGIDVTPIFHPGATGIRSSLNAPDERPSSSSFCCQRAA